MSTPRPGAVRSLIIGTGLAVAGVLAWALYFLQSASEPHAYAGGSPPAFVRLEPGHTYWMAVRGGVQREIALGLNPSSLQCTAAVSGQAPGALAVNPEPRETKETDRIGSFTASIQGNAQVQCGGLGTVFVENAADAPFDTSGLWLVMASILLAVGLPLAISGLRSAGASVEAVTDT